MEKWNRVMTLSVGYPDTRHSLKSEVTPFYLFVLHDNRDPLMALPLLKPSYVMRNIVDAILLEEQICILPRFATLAVYIK